MADLADIYGWYGRNVILFYPGQKKGKRGTKKGKSGFLSKIVQKSQKSNFWKNPDISYPFYPFYHFWSKTSKVIYFPSPPYFWSQKKAFRPAKVPFCKILKNWPKIGFSVVILLRYFQIYVPFLLFGQFQNHLRGKEP